MQRMPFYLAAVGGIALALCQWLIFAYAPLERSMGFAQKIFHTHVPLAWWAMISFALVFAASIAYLRTRKMCYDLAAWACAEVGVVFSSLALISGSIWGRHSWGVWWTWDPRLTTTLIMWFIYSAYLVLRRQGMGAERRAVLCAVLGIVAFVDVPLVFISARLWRSIHPSVFAAQGGGLEPEMRVTAIACVVAMGFIWAALVWVRTQQLRLEERLDTRALEYNEQEPTL